MPHCFHPPHLLVQVPVFCAQPRVLPPLDTELAILRTEPCQGRQGEQQESQGQAHIDPSQRPLQSGPMGVVGLGSWRVLSFAWEQHWAPAPVPHQCSWGRSASSGPVVAVGVARVDPSFGDHLSQKRGFHPLSNNRTDVNIVISFGWAFTQMLGSTKMERARLFAAARSPRPQAQLQPAVTARLSLAPLASVNKIGY